MKPDDLYTAKDKLMIYQKLMDQLAFLEEYMKENGRNSLVKVTYAPRNICPIYGQMLVADLHKQCDIRTEQVKRELIHLGLEV